MQEIVVFSCVFNLKANVLYSIASTICCTHKVATHFLVRKIYLWCMPDVFIHNQRFYNPVDYVLQQIGGTWKVPVLWRLRTKKLRYTELEKDIPHISQKMLTKALKELEAAGFVTKTVFAEVPPKVVYELSEKGRQLIPLIEYIRNFGINLMKTNGIDYDQMIRQEKQNKK